MVTDLIDKIRTEQNMEFKKKLTWLLIREMCYHSFAESEVLYPSLVKYLKEGQGKEFRDKCMAEHVELEKTLELLDGINGDSKENKYDGFFDAVIQWHTKHVAFEEKEVLPLLEKAAQSDTQITLGHEFCSSRNSAPSRPHPSAPKTPPASTVAAVALRAADALRDRNRFKDDGTPI